MALAGYAAVALADVKVARGGARAADGGAYVVLLYVHVEDVQQEHYIPAPQLGYVGQRAVHVVEDEVLVAVHHLQVQLYAPVGGLVGYDGHALKAVFARPGRFRARVGVVQGGPVGVEYAAQAAAAYESHAVEKPLGRVYAPGPHGGVGGACVAVL